MKESKELKSSIIDAGYKAVKHLIEVAEEKIITKDLENDLAADKLKNAAASKKLAIFDAFEILARIDQEREALTADKGKRELDDFTKGRAK